MEAPEFSKTIALVYPPEFGSKDLWLKTQHTLVAEHREIKLDLAWKLPTCWPVYIVLKHPPFWCCDPMIQFLMCGDPPPTKNLFSSLFHSCNVAAAMNCKVNILGDPCERDLWPPAHRLRTTVLAEAMQVARRETLSMVFPSDEPFLL